MAVDVYPLTYANKIIDLLINEEVFWVTSEEKLEEKKPPWVDTSVIADALDVGARAVVGVSETRTEVLCNWVDTLGLNDVDSDDDNDILWLRVDMILWGSAKYNNKICIRFPTKS